MPTPKFFKSPADWRAWLEKHHADERELLVGFYKKDSGKPSITWQESVDEALCFGWIDGVRKRRDEASYTIRFTPRRSRSIWSVVNTARVAELTRLGRMHPAGLAAFAARTDDRSAVYAYEQRKSPKLDPEQERRFREDLAAWEFFQAQPPSYRRLAQFWVVSAKRPETREKRLATLIADSAAKRRIGQL